jgi:hypothetical protein
MKMDKFPIKKIWPYLAAIAFFVVLGLLYFSPILEGKKLFQSDIVQWQGMSKEIVDYRAATGEEALWSNSMFSGMPAYQISVAYKNVLVKYIDKIFKLGLPHPINLVFLYFLGFFFLLLILRMNIWLAVLGSVAFAFSSYFFIILEAGHNSKAHAIAYMAPVIGGIILTYRGKLLWGAAVTALFLSLEIYTNHLQITYYLLLTVVVFGIAQLIDSYRKKELPAFIKSTLVLVVVAIFSVGVNISNIWATWEYGKYTIRGKTELTSEQQNRTSGLDINYVTQWSYGVPETFTLLIPNFMGGSSNIALSENSNAYKALINNGVPAGQAKQYIKSMPLYWGDQPGTSGPVYAGAIMIFLFFLGIFVVRGKMKWWLVAATVLSIMLAWGHNFMPFTEFFLHYVPGYNKFRAVTMILVIAAFTIPLLGILALREIFDPGQNKNEAFKNLKFAFYITGGITLFFAIFPGIFFNFVSPTDAQYASSGFPEWLIDALRDDRESALRMDSLRSFIFIALAAAAIWAVLFDKFRKEYAFAALILLVTVDMWTVNRRFLNVDSFETAKKVENPFRPSAADQQILNDKNPNFRVLNLTVNPFADASTSYYHKSLGGYHGAKLRRYQELYDNHISKNNMSVINMLNTKYFIVSGDDKQPQARLNPGALGNAWTVDEFDLVNNADEEIAALKDFDPSKTAIVDKRFSAILDGFQSKPGEKGSIQLNSYKPNELVYRYNSNKNELVVFSEIYYDKGWKALIDGKESPYFRANYVLRSMIVPAGQHEITWKFKPTVYYTGGTISLISSLLVLLFFFGVLGLELKQKLTTNK